MLLSQRTFGHDSSIETIWTTYGSCTVHSDRIAFEWSNGFCFIPGLQMHNKETNKLNTGPFSCWSSCWCPKFGKNQRSLHCSIAVSSLFLFWNLIQLFNVYGNSTSILKPQNGTRKPSAISPVLGIPLPEWRDPEPSALHFRRTVK